MTPANGVTIETGGAINTAAALIQAQNAGDFSFGNTGTFSIDPGAFTGAGAITLQANNDVTISNAIDDSSASDWLTIQAGRSIIDNANITYATALNLTANTHLAAVGVGTSGAAAFTMVAGATIRSSASINITLDSGIGLNPAGNVSIATLKAPAVTIADDGPAAGSSIVDPSGGDIIAPTVTLSAINGAIGQDTRPLDLTTATVTAQAASGIFLFGGGSLTLGNITNNSGEVNLAAVGSIAVDGAIKDNDGSSSGVVILNSAASGTTPANITFGPSGVVAGFNETFVAGDGDTATSAVNFANATLQGPTGAGSSPTFFSDQQDAPIVDAPLSSAQFGNGVPVHYALTSQQGSVAVATTTDVANSNLVLTSNAVAGAGGIDVGQGAATFTLASMSANTSAGNSIQLDSTAAGPQITTTGATIVDTIGDQSYSGAVTVGSDVALISSSGAISFGSTVDSSAGKAFGLTVAASTGTATFGGAVGGTEALSQFIVTATTIALDGGRVQSDGDQVYNGAMSLGAATDLNTAAHAVINFNGTVDGANALTIGNVNTAGEVVFGGNVGGSTAVTNLAVTATRILINGSAVVTSGAAGQTYNGDVFLGGTSPIALNTSAAGNRVTFNGDLTLGASYATATDILNVTGTLAFNNTSGRSTLYSTFNSQGSGVGAQAFGQINASSADLTGVNLSLTFATAPNIGSNSYTIVQGSGSTSFLNVTADNATKFYVSGVDFIADDSTNDLVLTPTDPTDAPLTVGSGGTYSTIQAAIDASLSGDVIEIDNTASPYAGFTTNNGTSNVSLLFDVVGGGNVQIDSAVTLTADTAFELSGTGLTFSGSNATIDGDVDLTFFAASTAENLDIQAAVGGGTPLNSFTTGAGVTTQLAANITTNTSSGGQTYYGNLQLQTSLTGHLATLTAKTATFNGSVGDGVAGGGEDSLSVTGNAVFSGTSNALGGLMVSGATLLNNSGITTKTTHGASGDQTYSGAVILGSAAATLTVPGTLSLAATNGVVGNGNFLTINGAGTPLTLSGSQIDDVGALTVTDNAGLTLGGDIVTGGTQSFSSTAGIGFNSNTGLTAVSAAGTFQTVTLGNTVDTPAQSLTINGNATFDDNVTVSSLNIAGTTAFQTSAATTNVTTTQGQTYLGAVSNTGGANALDLTDSGGAITVGAGLSAGGAAITLTAGTNVTVSGDISNTGAHDIDVTAGANVTIATGSTVESGAGTVTLNVGAADAGSSSLIEGAVGGTSVLVQGGSGNDDLTLDYTHGTSLPDGLTFNGGGGANTLTVTDAGGAAAHTYTLGGSGVARDGGPLIAVTSVQSVLVTGGNGNDVFNVTPSSTITFTLNGSSNGAAGDQLNYLASNLPVRVVPGKFTANFLQGVIFANFEKLNLENAAGVNTIAGPDTADRSTAFTGLTADEDFIQTLYLDDLGRAGSKTELDGWLRAFDSGGSTAVASGIQVSQEARDHLVRSWYLTYLGRAANGGEEQIWVNLLATESEEQVLSTILSDSGHEFFNRAQTLISSGTADERYVEALYLVLLDRSPSAADLQSWINVLPQIGLQGIAIGILHSTEFRTDLFESYYDALLDRPSDAPGLNSWVSSVLDTAQVRVAFGGSPEFFTDG